MSFYMIWEIDVENVSAKSERQLSEMTQCHIVIPPIYLGLHSEMNEYWTFGNIFQKVSNYC